MMATGLLQKFDIINLGLNYMLYKIKLRHAANTFA